MPINHSTIFRTLSAAVLMSVAQSACALVERPSFVTAAPLLPGYSRVSDVLETETGTFILLGHGLNAAYRRGQVLEVFRENRPIASILLISVEDVAAVGMIRDLAANESIRYGDVTRYSRI